MNHERKHSREKRRERLMPDLDRFETTQHLHYDDEPPTPAREALHAALRDALTTALTDKQREAVEAFFFEGLSQGEIARRLGVSQQVVQKRIYGTGRNGKTVGGALRKLRDVLEPLLINEQTLVRQTTHGFDQPVSS